MAFWILWGIDALVALVFVVFFLIGLGDGTVSSFNIALWAGILIALAGLLGGSLALRAKGHRGAAIALLSLLAVPAVLCGVLFLAALILQPRWN